MNILFGILTIAVLVGIGYLFSENRKAINWRIVGTGILSQIVVMFIVLKTNIGSAVLTAISDGLTKILSFGMEGIEFIFGDLTSSGAFAITVLGVICFTSSLIAVLYYLRIIPILVKFIGSCIAKIMKSTPVESFCAVGNAFLGGTEAPLLTKPYLKDLTRSELFAVILGGFASVSVSVVLGYVTMGLNMEFILVQMATVPFSTLLMAKILVPETEKSKTAKVEPRGLGHANIFDAIGGGAVDGMQVALSVGAVGIAFVSFMGLVNWILGFIGTDLTQIFTVILTPLAWLLNIPSNEVATFTSAIGLKTAINEYVAISTVGPMVADLSLRTQAMLTIALVNFANFSVIGITIAGFSSFCPEKKVEVSGLGMKALFGGILTTLVSTALIGMFF